MFPEGAVQAVQREAAARANRRGERQHDMPVPQGAYVSQAPHGAGRSAWGDVRRRGHTHVPRLLHAGAEPRQLPIRGREGLKRLPTRAPDTRIMRSTRTYLVRL